MQSKKKIILYFVYKNIILFF